jgi:hypothetical protein
MTTGYAHNILVSLINLKISSLEMGLPAQLVEPQWEAERISPLIRHWAFTNLW